MEITFEYKGVRITTPNLEKKLKRMKITKDDVIIIEDTPKVIKEESDEKEIALYTFINPKGCRITSIYNKCPEGYNFENKKIYKV